MYSICDVFRFFKTSISYSLYPKQTEKERSGCTGAQRSVVRIYCLLVNSAQLMLFQKIMITRQCSYLSVLNIFKKVFKL